MTPHRELAELWIATSRVCECCDIHVETIAQPPGWMVRITRKDGKGSTQANGDHLVAAVMEAVKRAEQKGFGV